MIKEFIFVAPHSDAQTIQTVHIGIFPPRGRYFRRQMEHDGSGFFRTHIEVNKGEIFYHYFLNNDFTRPFNSSSEELISKNNILKLNTVIIGTEPFCTVQFDAQEQFIFTLGQGTWVIRAVTHHSWVQSLSLLGSRLNNATDLKEFPFRAVYNFCGKKYWLLLLETEVGAGVPFSFFVLKLEGSHRRLFLHRDNIIDETPDYEKFFPFPDHSDSPGSPGTVPVDRVDAVEKNLPSWSVGYQIMPDRFLKSAAQTHRDYFSPWGESPGYYSYFGGDLRGIIQKLPYLQDLGINFLYLNPIFYARTYHRYDTIDYYCIDPILGKEGDLDELVQEAHRLGIKIILDLPLNHCSIDFFAFRDILVNQENSPYRHWFHIHRFPVEVKEDPPYGSWHGNQDMPEFNLHHPDVHDYLARVASYWIKRFDIDGWRLDACTSMPSEFTRFFVADMKNVKEDIILIGESWHHESSWLFREVGIHGLTDYSFYWRVVVPLLEKATLALDKIAEAIMDLNYRYSYKYGRYCWNFLSNHDLPRLYSIMADKSNYKNAIALLYALPGMPIIYYGEETGLQGLGDPDNRRCMEWPPPDKDIRFGNLYKTLNRLRKDHKTIFSQGNIAIPYLDNKKGLLILERFTSWESMYFIFNFSSVAQHVPTSSINKKIVLLDPVMNKEHDVLAPAIDLEGNSFKILYTILYPKEE